MPSPLPAPIQPGSANPAPTDGPSLAPTRVRMAAHVIHIDWGDTGAHVRASRKPRRAVRAEQLAATANRPAGAILQPLQLIVTWARHKRH